MSGRLPSARLGLDIYQVPEAHLITNYFPSDIVSWEGSGEIGWKPKTCAPQPSSLTSQKWMNPYLPGREKNLHGPARCCSAGSPVWAGWDLQKSRTAKLKLRWMSEDLSKGRLLAWMLFIWYSSKQNDQHVFKKSTMYSINISPRFLFILW